MILADTSIWIDHFKGRNDRMSGLLRRKRVVTHPWVVGELFLGGVPREPQLVMDLDTLSLVTVAGDAEVAVTIDRQNLTGTGLGYVDAALLAATLLTVDTTLWTLDRRLHAVADRLGVAAQWTD